MLRRFGMARDTMTQVLVGGLELAGEGDGREVVDYCVKIGLDAKGEEKWAGESAACGKWRGAVEERFERAGVRCRVGFIGSGGG